MSYESVHVSRNGRVNARHVKVEVRQTTLSTITRFANASVQRIFMKLVTYATNGASIVPAVKERGS